MAENTQTEAPSMAKLVGDIIGDAQRLVRQELTLARREIQLEMDKAKTALTSLLIGGSIALLGATFLGLMLVFLLYSLTNGSNERFPLWGCFGIVGAVLAVIGGALLYLGKVQAREVHVVPPQTAETLKENVEWLQNQNQK